MKFLIGIAGVAIVITFLWVLCKPGWDSISALFASGLTLGGLLVVQKNRTRNVSMKQTGGRKSKNYQSAGDINITK